MHYGTIIINAEAKIGANCRINACTNIGQSGGMTGVPVIAANAVVNKSFTNENTLIGGIPAKEICSIEL